MRQECGQAVCGSDRRKRILDENTLSINHALENRVWEGGQRKSFHMIRRTTRCKKIEETDTGWWDNSWGFSVLGLVQTALVWFDVVDVIKRQMRKRDRLDAFVKAPTKCQESFNV